eukprot:UN28514
MYFNDKKKEKTSTRFRLLLFFFGWICITWVANHIVFFFSFLKKINPKKNNQMAENFVQRGLLDNCILIFSIPHFHYIIKEQYYYINILRTSEKI